MIRDASIVISILQENIVDDIFGFLNEKKLVPSSGRVYDFKNIRDAVIAQDNGAVNGKIVVIM